MTDRRAVVFGSINLDLVARTPHLPIPGETLLGHSFAIVPGGKGANQAVALARLGVATTIVGRVGQDSFGQQLLASLQVSGVNTEGVFIHEGCHSGVAVIAVDDLGENHIIVIPEANGQVDEGDVERLRALLTGAKALLLQLEVPLPAVCAAAQVADQVGVPVILDPAPARTDLPEELLATVDILTPNLVEAEHLVGFSLDSLDAVGKAAGILRQQGVKTVIITLGPEGVFCASADETFLVPAFPVKAIDTVAAGDAFNGGLVAALVEGLSLRQAIVWGVGAGALAVTKSGAQDSLPDRAMLDAFLQERSSQPGP